MKRIIVNDKLFTYFNKPLIRYKGELYYENAPMINIGGKTYYKRKAINFLIKYDMVKEVAESEVERVR